MALIALALGALAGCDQTEAKKDEPLKTVADYFDIKVGSKVVHMQLAVTGAEQQHGLMDRRDLGADQGMLFIFDHPQQMSFWMHNTPTALDIGFFDDGGLLEEIYPMQPFDENSIHSRSTMLTLALEMNQGWYQSNGVKPGAQIDLKALVAALKARGFDPKRLGVSAGE
jgi:uncharacterized membrane protein (UPF0127 family)